MIRFKTDQYNKWYVEVFYDAFNYKYIGAFDTEFEAMQYAVNRFCEE